jgi:hypothetical protein
VTHLRLRGFWTQQKPAAGTAARHDHE